MNTFRKLYDRQLDISYGRIGRKTVHIGASYWYNGKFTATERTIIEMHNTIILFRKVDS